MTEHSFCRFLSYRIVLLLLAMALLPHPTFAMQSGEVLVRIGVVLPLKEKTSRGAKMVEFYQGLLFAVDSLRQEGISTEVQTFHSGSSAADIETLLAQNTLSECNVIFGPLDVVQLPAMADYCDANGIRLVVPFSTQTTQLANHPRYYMASAPRTIAQREAAWYVQNIFPEANIIAVETTEANDEGFHFIHNVMDAVAENDIVVRQLQATEDETALEAVINPGRRNLFILDSSTLKALNLTLPKLRAYKLQHPEVEISLIGYPAWQAYTQQFLMDFYAFDTYIYTPFYRNPLSPRVQAFDARFARWLKNTPQATFPCYALMGFDLGYFFIRGYATYGDNLENHLDQVPSNPLQNSFFFERQGENDGFVNSFIEMIHYTTYQTIDILTRNKQAQ